MVHGESFFAFWELLVGALAVTFSHLLLTNNKTNNMKKMSIAIFIHMGLSHLLSTSIGILISGFTCGAALIEGVAAKLQESGNSFL